MLPFVRMLEYGNLAPGAPKIKYMQGFSNGAYVLFENGELYGTGANAYGLLMVDSQVQLKKWKLLSTGVDYFWLCGYGALIKMQDGRWMYLGSQLVLGTGTGKHIALQDISSSLSFVIYDSANPSATKIQMNFDGMFYLHGTDLYGRGYNRFYSLGLGNTTAYSAFRPLATGVKDFAAQDLTIGCMYVSTSNVYYYAGNDGSTYLKNNTFGSIRTSPFNHVAFNCVKNGWQVYTDGDIWAYGKNNYGAFGVSGNTNPLTTPTPVTNYAIIRTKNPRVSLTAGEFSSFILLDDGLYACGNNILGSAGGAFEGSSTIYLPSVLPSNVTAQDIKYYSAASGTSLFCTEDTIYFCGLTEMLPGASTASYSWVTIPNIFDNLL